MEIVSSNLLTFLVKVFYSCNSFDEFVCVLHYLLIGFGLINILKNVVWIGYIFVEIEIVVNNYGLFFR